MDKDKDKDKDKINNEEKNKKIDPYLCPEIDSVIDIYKKECPDLIKITFERRNQPICDLIVKFLKEIEFNLEYFREVCKSANTLKVIAGNNIDLKSVINNHIGIKTGKYITSNPIDSNKLVFD